MNILIKDILTVISEKTTKNDIYISGDTIVSLSNKPDGFIAEKVISGADKLAVPALINCHTHSYMSLFRNIADDLPFDKWLFDKIMPLEDIITPDDAYWGCMLGCAEMIKSGTGTFLDMHMFPGITPKVANKCKMRAVVSRGLSGDENDKEGGNRRLNEAKEEIEEYSGNPLIGFMVAPHSIYTCDRNYLEKAMALAEQFGVPQNIHVSESAFEVETCLKEKGVTPVEYLNQIGFFDNKTVAAHCVHITDRDIEILSERSVSVATNPRSNLKLGNGIAPIKKLLDMGVNICLGTDSAASNNSLNMFSEMNYTALIHKGVNRDATAVSSSDVFSFATENGGKALGIEKLGKIKEGYKADIALLDLNCPQLRPLNNPVSALSYSANGSEVDTMIVGGEVLMENRKLTSLDEEEVYYNVERIIKKFGGIYNVTQH